MNLIETYEAGLQRILQQYKSDFDLGPSQFLGCIAKFDSVRGCLLLIYQMQVNKNLLKKIEDLPQDEKKGFWIEAKKIGNNGEVKYLTELCKCLHVLGNSI